MFTASQGVPAGERQELDQEKKGRPADPRPKQPVPPLLEL